MRGAQLLRRRERAYRGIIPACAGSTLTASSPQTSTRDHPRMCGEHPASPSPRAVTQGSSPHVRGAPAKPRDYGRAAGIIPACAGSTTCSLEDHCLRRDHPRMCGEHPLLPAFAYHAEGSSPHVRGAPQAPMLSELPCGIIPACAGSTTCRPRARPPSRDHPRMCGEHRSELEAVGGKRGIIPACAGSTTDVYNVHASTKGSSPHVRGAPTPRTGLRTWSRDHPRMCGEHTIEPPE